MFFQLFKYRLIVLLRSKDQLFWTLLFPILLGTMFFLAFNNIKTAEEFKSIPIAVVKEQSTDTAESFQKMLEALDSDEDTQYFTIQYLALEEAQEQLNKNEIDGILVLDDTVELLVKENGINQSILKNVVDNYLQMENMIIEIMQTHPEQMENIADLLETDQIFNKEITLSSNDAADNTLNYFYALIAMTCLYGAFFGLNNADCIQANLSTLGARRCCAPTHKMRSIIADFIAAVLLQFVEVLVLLFYLINVLKIDFGNQFLFIALTALVGSVIGVAYGTFIGAVVKAKEGVKIAILVGVTMLMCFLSGLMFGNMKDIIEHNIPILNRINPAVLISESLYSLNIYDTYTRFTQNMILMLIIAGLFCIGSYLATRREKYDSI